MEKIFDIAKDSEQSWGTLATAIDENNEIISNSLEESGISSLFSFENSQIGFFVDANGAKSNNVSFSMTEPLPVPTGTKIILRAVGHTTNVAMISSYEDGIYTPLVVSRSSELEEYSYMCQEDLAIVLSYNHTKKYSGEYLLVVADYAKDLNSKYIEENNINLGLKVKQDLSDAVEGHFVFNDGHVASNTLYAYKSGINLFEGDSVEFTATGHTTNVAMISSVNEDLTFTPLVVSIDTTNRKYTYTAPKAITIAVSFRISDKHDLFIRTNVRKVLYHIPKAITLKDVFGCAGLFPKIAVIGDSLSSGQLEDSGSGVNYGDNYGSSWLSFLARHINADVRKHYSEAGITCKDWLTESPYSGIKYLEQLQTDETTFNAYFIALGTNDSSKKPYDLGDIDDEAGSNSFVGYYKQIIEAILEKAPNAAIFCVSLYKKANEDYTEMIRLISSLYNNAFFIDYISNAQYLLGDSRVSAGSHFSTYGYNYVASVIYQCICDIVDNNLDFFKYWGHFNLLAEK